MSFLQMKPLRSPPKMSGGRERKPMISAEVLDERRYWYSRKSEANARKLF